MRCPKCHYISFDSGARCRNCGYDFSLSAAEAPLDLPIQTGDEASGPLADLRLGRENAAPHAGIDPGPGQLAQHDLASHGRPAGTGGLDLPLFSGRDGDDDRPLVSASAVPRPPLAVRRGSPIAARPRPRNAADPDEPALALELPEDEPEPDRAERRAESLRPRPLREAASPAAEPGYATAPLGRRLFAGIIDASIVAAIDAAIVYFTLRLCGLELQEIASLPPVPFLTFVLMLNGGYFAAFVAAGGQTIGKMAAGIRVIPHQADAGVRVPFGQAVLRAAAYLVSVLPAGLGLLPALFSADRRALHDRLADTRVVRG